MITTDSMRVIAAKWDLIVATDYPDSNRYGTNIAIILRLIGIWLSGGDIFAVRQNSEKIAKLGNTIFVALLNGHVN